MVPHFRHLSQTELAMFGGQQQWAHGWGFTTVICDSPRYLRHLMARFKKVCWRMECVPAGAGCCIGTALVVLQYHLPCADGTVKLPSAQTQTLHLHHSGASSHLSAARHDSTAAVGA